MTPTKARVLDAAIELLGTKGLRALTHARVDERAGLPKGSASNYFRTRQALVSGVVERVAELERPELGSTFTPPASAAELLDGLCGLLDHLTQANRTQTTARLVLFMEASHDAALRDTLSRAHDTMIAAVVLTLARLGVRDPVTTASAISACFEGLLLHRIARHDDTDPRPVFELVLKATLG
ncbi:TetR/AcrR family transcriptional regulator [Georgenia sp. SYP-B2076]|uniref:TetR/AcrR family transcriptional regulator n=1 Tax=Georgenia sp. SYP-B2076 TaxID=2495881 RepID=UPI000F8C9651|nr:TetR/AcrR family transcriptional regulator [Georgenia sp. SYP-B2076]